MSKQKINKTMYVCARLANEAFSEGRSYDGAKLAEAAFNIWAKRVNA